jgi:hypothetical protein
MTGTLKKLIIALGITLVAGGIYFYYESQTEVVDDFATAEQGVVGDIATESAQVVAAIYQLETIMLDTKILKDERFLSLKDYTIPIVDVSTGRTNPFEPVQ